MTTYVIPEVDNVPLEVANLTLIPLRLTHSPVTYATGLALNMPLLPTGIHFVPGRITATIKAWQTGNPTGVRPS